MTAVYNSFFFNSLLPECNARCDMYQMAIYVGLHIEGHDRVSAMPVIRRSERHAT